MSVRQWLLLVATAASFASSILINKVLIGQLPPLTLAAMRVLLAAPIAFAVLVALGRQLPQSRIDRRTCVLVQSVGATHASVAMFLMPMIAVLFGTVFLGERLGANALAGMALILAGNLVVNGVGAHGRRAAQAGAEAAVPAR